MTHSCKALFLLVLAFLLGSEFWSGAGSQLVACPFCSAVAPSLCQRQASAEIVLLAEVSSAGTAALRFKSHRILKGRDKLESQEQLDAIVDDKVKPGELVILFGGLQGSEIRWSAMVANEAVVGYFFAAPSLRENTNDRLRYFARHLEHSDGAIAEDAYVEFANAPFDAVVKVADDISSKSLREWIKSEHVPESRKGLYGLLLGMARQIQLREENAAFLQQEIDADAPDFRAGFDGILGGYLLLTGNAGLKHLEARFLANPRASVVDVRHAMTALRFYYEHGKEIATADLTAALAKVLDRPEFAEAAIIDLARWQAWQFESQIVSLYDRPGYETSETRRAIIGYLRTSDLRSAAEALATIREKDPHGVAAAEEVLGKYGSMQSR